jgi:hypothetical protein
MSDDSQFCSKCGLSVMAISASSALPTGTAATGEIPMHMSNASVQVKTKLNWVFIGLAIFLCLLANFPQMEAGDVGGPAASLLLPCLVAFVLRGRKGDWKGFSKWFFWVTVIMLYAVYWNHHQLPPTSAGRY